MTVKTPTLLALAALSASAAGAHAQFSIPWSTIDCGGGSASGGAFTLQGSIGQADASRAGELAGGPFTLTGGVQLAIEPTAPACRADFNDNGLVNIDDIFIFLNAWFANDTRSDINASGLVNIDDIFIFLNLWFTGCP